MRQKSANDIVIKTAKYDHVHCAYFQILIEMGTEICFSPLRYLTSDEIHCGSVYFWAC